jgi:hypothetical protein
MIVDKYNTEGDLSNSFNSNSAMEIANNSIGEKSRYEVKEILQKHYMSYGYKIIINND